MRKKTLKIYYTEIDSATSVHILLLLIKLYFVNSILIPLTFKYKLFKNDESLNMFRIK